MTADNRPRWLERADRIGRWTENALLMLLLAALIGLAGLQILLRNVFSAGISWADGGVRLIVLWLAVIGAVAAARDHRHLAINLATRWLPKSWHGRVDALASGFAAVISALLAWYALSFVMDSRSFGDILLGGLPAWMLQAVMPVGFALIAYRFALRCLGSLWRGK